MKPFKIILIIAFLFGLLLWGGTYWIFQKTVNQDYSSVPQPVIKTQTNSPPQRNQDQLFTKPVSWKEKYKELEPSDLIILPMRDGSGLGSSMNFEIREYPGRLIQSLMFIGEFV